jgi:hypothetical protein
VEVLLVFLRLPVISEEVSDMKDRMLFPQKRASGMLAGAVALFLMSAALSGLVWAIAGGEADQARHPNGGAMIVERSGQCPIENVLVNRPVYPSPSALRDQHGCRFGNLVRSDAPGYTRRRRG